MNCKNCGKEISESSAFCSGCGQAVENVESNIQQNAEVSTAQNEQPKESIINTDALKNQVKGTLDKVTATDKTKIKKLAPIVAGALAILILIISIIISATSKVPLKNYISEEVGFGGINGYGYVEVDDLIDEDALQLALVAGSVSESDWENEEFWEYSLSYITDYIDYEWSENNGSLSNGDTVTLTVTIDKDGIKNNPLYKKKISGKETQTFKFKVEGLEDGVVIDIFDAVECCYYDKTSSDNEYILSLKSDYSKEYEKGITVVTDDYDTITVYGDDFYSFSVPIRLASDKVSDKAATTKIVLGKEQNEYVDLGIVFKETEKSVKVKHLDYVKNSNTFDKETLKVLQDKAVETAKERIDINKYALTNAMFYVGGELSNQYLAYFFKGSDGFYVVGYEDMKCDSENKIYELDSLEPVLLASWWSGPYKFTDMENFYNDTTEVKSATNTEVQIIK